MTAFARVDSPFRWHGNHAFVDALSLVRAPVAWFEPLPPQTSSGRQLDLVWQARQSPDAAAVEGGTFELLVDIEVRPEGGEWRELATGLQDESVYSFLAPYRDRIRIPHPGARRAAGGFGRRMAEPTLSGRVERAGARAVCAGCTRANAVARR